MFEVKILPRGVLAPNTVAVERILSTILIRRLSYRASLFKTHSGFFDIFCFRVYYPSWIPGLGRSAGKGIGYPFQYSWASLVAQLVKNPPAMQETWV